ncbi:MAG: hypothetical protein Ta2D_01860 [Rickettsiales bacterium]|nr:MAG: hypothetical protein Ta2D_01860 [Rickettsiales bacterium]
MTKIMLLEHGGMYRIIAIVDGAPVPLNFAFIEDKSEKILLEQIKKQLATINKSPIAQGIRFKENIEAVKEQNLENLTNLVNRFNIKNPPKFIFNELSNNPEMDKTKIEIKKLEKTLEKFTSKKHPLMTEKQIDNKIADYRRELEVLKKRYSLLSTGLLIENIKAGEKEIEKKRIENLREVKNKERAEFKKYWDSMSWFGKDGKISVIAKSFKKSFLSHPIKSSLAIGAVTFSLLSMLFPVLAPVAAVSSVYLCGSMITDILKNRPNGDDWKVKTLSGKILYGVSNFLKLGAAMSLGVGGIKEIAVAIGNVGIGGVSGAISNVATAYSQDIEKPVSFISGLVGISRTTINTADVITEENLTLLDGFNIATNIVPVLLYSGVKVVNNLNVVKSSIDLKNNSGVIATSYIAHGLDMVSPILTQEKDVKKIVKENNITPEPITQQPLSTLQELIGRRLLDAISPKTIGEK